jgi:hypothetical protein
MIQQPQSEPEQVEEEEWYERVQGPGAIDAFDRYGHEEVERRVLRTILNPYDEQAVYLVGDENGQDDFVDNLSKQTLVKRDIFEKDGKIRKLLYDPSQGEYATGSVFASKSKTRKLIAEVRASQSTDTPITTVVPLWQDGHDEYLKMFCDALPEVTVYSICYIDPTGQGRSFAKRFGTSAPEAFRESCKSFGQLTTELPKYLIDGLMPANCLTAITGHSFNGKSWCALQAAWALAEGSPLFGYFPIGQPVPVLYNVPEMHEAQVRQYAGILGVRDTESLLFRTMEDGAWQLDDPRMLKAAEGRVVFLDTLSFFNPAEDGNSYAAAMKQFGVLIFNLLNVGALGVTILGHLAKPMQNKTGRAVEQPWTLENSIIGSAGYGALLRSLLRVKNLNEDLNDHAVHLYVQGMKNPGLKPFQLQGPAPLKMLVEPGKSPYLSQLLSGDANYAAASVLFEKKVVQRQVAEQLKISLGTVNKLHKQWKKEKEEAESIQGGLTV